MTHADQIVRALLDADEDEETGLHKEIEGEPPPHRDFIVGQHGSLWTISPQNKGASEWLHAIIGEDATWVFHNMLIVEHRYVLDILMAIQEDGWQTNVKLVRRNPVGESEDEAFDTELVKDVGQGQRSHRNPPSNCPYCHGEREWSGTGDKAVCHFCGRTTHSESIGEAEDDEETIKDILGADYLEPPPEESPLEGTVERFDRWADIKIGDKNFCISYLTPVAVYIPGQGAMITDKGWSTSTKRHIVKWMNHIGLGPAGDYHSYRQVEERFPKVPQQELIDLFKRESKRVPWTKRQVRRAEHLPPIKMGLKIGSEQRVSIYPHTH